MILPLLLIFSFLSFQRTSEWADGLSLWGAAVERGPLMPRSHLCLGLALKDESRWPEAWREFETCRALAMGRHDAGMASRALNNLGSVAFTLKRFDEAERYYQQALDLVPDYEDAMANMASMMLAKAQATRRIDLLDCAISGYQGVLSKRPMHAQTWGNLGLALHMRGDKVGAERAYRRSLSLMPSGEVSRNLQGLVQE